MSNSLPPSKPVAAPADASVADEHGLQPEPPAEIGGRESGLEPTRYGDWEKNGRCIDF